MVRTHISLPTTTNDDSILTGHTTCGTHMLLLRRNERRMLGEESPKPPLLLTYSQPPRKGKPQKALVTLRARFLDIARIAKTSTIITPRMR